MRKITVEGSSDQPAIAVKTALEEVLQAGAMQMLQAAIENEVAEYVGRHTEPFGSDLGKLFEQNSLHIIKALEMCLRTPFGLCFELLRSRCLA